MYLKDFLKELSEIEQTYKQELLESNYDSDINYKNLFKRISDKYHIIDNKINSVKTRVANKVLILRAKNPKLGFFENDEGAVHNYDVIQQWKTIQNLIFDRVGYSYLRYFRKVLYSQIEIFHDALKKFKKKLKKRSKFYEKSWLCRDARQLILN